MRKLFLGFLVAMFVGAAVYAQDENLSLKAGPTDPGEGLSLVWVEAFVYPKVVGDERALSLGVRAASRVEAVKATFDFNSEAIALSSSDGAAWSGVYKIPAEVSAGVHVARYQITGAHGSIQRTLEFFVVAEKMPEVSSGEVLPVSSWPLTVISTCTAFSDTSVRKLAAGQKLVGISKAPWYKVLFADGKEGWVPAAQVKEPTEDFYYLGYEAYQAKNYSAAADYYRRAVAVNPQFVKGYLWLAKSCAAQENWGAAVKAIMKALRQDERDIDCRVVAAALAQKCFALAHDKFKSGRYHEAVAAYRRTLDLKPSSVLSWIEMGESLRELGLESEAHDAWREGLRYDPDNQELRALLDTEYEIAVEPEKESLPASQTMVAVAPLLADDSLQMVKSEKTHKGTKIEAAIKSVVALTKSLGTPVVERGWQIKKQGEKFLASYLCEQSGGALESFDWLVDVDTRQVVPHNDNARLLMSRW